jgi:hypothetical protein
VPREDTVRVALAAEAAVAAPTADELRSLRAELAGTAPLAGAVGLVVGGVGGGVLTVALGSDTALPALAEAVVGWLRWRTPRARVVLARGDRRIELSVHHVRGRDGASLTALAGEVTAALSADQRR